MTEAYDWMERILRADRVSPVEDGGFAEALMTRLPTERVANAGWIVPASTAAGAILAAAVTLSEGLVPAVRSLASGHIGGTAVLLPLFLIWAGSAWILSESE